MFYKSFEWIENPDGYFENANFQKLLMGKVAYECGCPLQEEAYFNDEDFDLYTPFIECLEAIGDSMDCINNEWNCEDLFAIKCRQLDIYSNLLKEYAKHFGIEKAVEIDKYRKEQLEYLNKISFCMDCDIVKSKRGIMKAFVVNIYEQFDHFCDTVYILFCIKKHCEESINFMRNEFKKSNKRKKVAA